jgi:predicted GNAT superfamily acetyltransferase
MDCMVTGMYLKTMIQIKNTELQLDTIRQLEEMVFGESRITPEKLQQISQQQALLLTAVQQHRRVGFKLGYVLPGTRIFFSWLGGVHPEHRRQGIAQALLNRQEELARSKGLEKIYFTTFDRFPAMIRLGIKNGYQLAKSAPDGGEIKYWYEKQLS